jgi:ATP-dependent exoDNAse (exonuclease V) beta subunit
MNFKIISAGAGSGKTYRLTSEMVDLLSKEKVRANGIIATTFTNKAAAELQERVRVRLLEEGHSKAADDLTNALIGTVHGLGVKLLKRFAFEAGVSPEVAIIADEDQQVLFNQSLSTVLHLERVEKVEKLCEKLGLHKRERFDWRKIVKQITEVARTNDFGEETLHKSKELSFSSFQEFLGEQSNINDFSIGKAKPILENTIHTLENGEDATKITQTAIKDLKNLQNELNLRGQLHWHQWVKMSKIKVGAKSRDAIEELKEFAQKHESHPDFQNDIKEFIFNVFDIAIAAINEYDEYKKRRGLIDYTDMEVLIKELLKNKSVQEVLSEELDLLMVDEFQDTSPIQLEIFLKLSKFAKYSIWVGDPKQSIYGFRGAEPKLMQAIIEKNGGVKPEDIQGYSWRSREDIVFATNALFVKAFSDLPKEQIALKPKRQKVASDDSVNKINEPPEVGDALIHWHLKPDIEGKRMPGKPWTENAIASTLVTFLERKPIILPKGEKDYRAAKPGDVAILCKTNKQCQEMAEALHRAGLKAAISRAGLLNTAESKLILACLKFILNKYDSLSIAEILLLAANLSIEEIIEDRLEYLEKLEDENEHLDFKWGEQNEFIGKLNDLRTQVVELSSAEILNLLLEELDLRRIIVSWGKKEQRLANVDVLRKLALQYEEACNRLHTAASLGGLLLWLNDLENNAKDMQGSGENEDTVNVLTYHRSKGLEWPVVICHSLESNIRGDVWGVSIVSENDEIDLDNILGNRWLRYWINPYSDQIRGTALNERIEESEAKIQALKAALQEEARLLYVGITRARDYLVFPTRPTPTKWLNRVWHDGKDDFPTLDPNNFETPWEWNGKYLTADTEVFIYPKEFGHHEHEKEQIHFIEEHAGKDIHIPYQIDLHSETLNGQIKPEISSIKQYAPPIILKDDLDKYTIAKVVKAFLTADEMDYDIEERMEMATSFLQRYEVADLVEAKAMLKFSTQWFDWLEKEFKPKKIHRKYPIRMHRNGRLFKTIIDLVIETDRGLVLIQNSGFGGDSKKWKQKACELGDWLFLSKTALREVFNTVNIRTMVHFVLSGAVLEVEAKEEVNLFS